MTEKMPLIDIKPEHLKIVRTILEKYVPEYAVWAFGSRAKRTAKKYSDLDLAVMTDQPLPLKTKANLSDAFSESDLPYKVDVVDWVSLDEWFREIVRKDAVVIFRQDSKTLD
jgi:type I restriction enzyme S subunit